MGLQRLRTTSQQLKQRKAAAGTRNDEYNANQNSRSAIIRRWITRRSKKASVMWMRQSSRTKIALVSVCVLRMENMFSFLLKQCEKNGQPTPQEVEA